tara:strand:+ start:363 stop:518 length:156 start_codon:yes stop_codon:yes gene_type:complete
MKLLFLLLVFSCTKKHKTKLEEMYKREEIVLPDDEELDDLPEAPGLDETTD